MPSLTIRNLPRDVHRSLKERAKRHRRSLNSEIIEILSRPLPARPIDPGKILAEIAAINRKYPGFSMTHEEIRAAKEEGRM